MKAKLTHVLFAMLFSAPAFAQTTSKDSLQALNTQQKVIDLSKEINEKRIEVAEKQNDLQKKQILMQETTEKAQASADANTVAASELTENLQDKKLARKAYSAANDAQRDAKNARKASDNVDKLDEEIAIL